MPAFKSYPNVLNTPSRKTRKADRAKTFLFNKHVVKAARKERRLTRKEAVNAE